MMTKARVVWFSDVSKEDVALVGGKGANLGEMTRSGFPVPNGFIVTSNAYYDFLKENNLVTKIKHLLSTANYTKMESLSQVSSHIKKVIRSAAISEETSRDIAKYYKKLGGIFGQPLVAVRSSATAEDLPTASFAGQQETFLNVKGETNVLLKVKEAWASLFDARAIFYRHERHFDHFRIGIAVPVQKMVESEKSGVMFTLDPVTNDRTKIIIEAIYGLGEFIVQGKTTPDHYEIAKSDFKLLSKTIALQNTQYKKKGTQNKEVKVAKSEREKQKISDKYIEELTKIGAKLEKHYFFPQDIEWAIEKNKVYIVQTRPVTTVANLPAIKKEIALPHLPLLLKGDPASPGIASGPVKIIHKASEIGQVASGDVLVAPQTNPDYVSSMKKAVAIITDKGGRTSHAAIVSRELGIPAVVGTDKATKMLHNGNVVTVNGSNGEVYKGGHFQRSEFRGQSSEYKELKTKTRVYVNLAEPELAGEAAALPVDGIGLLRAEFMMAQIGAHPKKMIHDRKKHIFVQTLAQGLEQFCKAFYPRPVVYRTSDFKTNEYRNLIGGKDYEPIEPNPMLGLRGAFRYINDPKVFELELEAIKIVRNKKEFKNLWMMLPFVRTVKELTEVKKLISAAGLTRSESFKLWMMVEIPSNVILLEQFINAGIDGVSVGSNDLTMLLLGTDRDNSEVAREFNEEDPSVLWALEYIVKTCKKRGITSSICGQAVSTYPSLVEKLVSWGVTSVSVSKDAVYDTKKTIFEAEQK